MADQPIKAASPPVQLPGWAHASGTITLGHGAQDANAQARQMVIERVARYCWAYDERRADMLADCFTNDATWRGTVLNKVPIGPLRTRQGIIDWLTDFWPHQHDQRRHMVLNNIVENLDEKHAVTLSYLLLMSSDGKTSKIECTGFYRCALSCEGGIWRISDMLAGFDAPFWPGALEQMSTKGRQRHGVFDD